MDARDRRAKRVFLTLAAETPMRVMRKIAAGVREDALSGLSTADRDRFVDALLTIKSNLMSQANGASKASKQGVG
jgi:DNA-binding MarR family transcriptional regulator